MSENGLIFPTRYEDRLIWCKISENGLNYPKKSEYAKNGLNGLKFRRKSECA